MTSGFLRCDKPAGITSHDVVASVRREHPGVRVGHCGTLDPFATGLLLVLIGRATKIQRLLLGLPKRYETVARLGWTSSTGDCDGELVETGVLPPDPLVLPTGLLRQRPPVFSAVKIDGRRAYARARAGETVEMPEREVEVTEFREDWRRDGRAAFTIGCGSGTYVRSLIADLGDAYCEQLRRTEIGPFALAEAGPVPLALADALARVVPVIALGDEDAISLGHGRRVPFAGDEDCELLCVDPSGVPAALARPIDGVLVSTVGFRA